MVAHVLLPHPDNTEASMASTCLPVDVSWVGLATKVPRCACAGAAYDIRVKDTAHNSQSRADLSRSYRRTGSAVIARQDLAAARGASNNGPAHHPRAALNFASLPAAVTADWRQQIRQGGLASPTPPSQAAQEGEARSSGQVIGSLTVVLQLPVQASPQAAPCLFVTAVVGGVGLLQGCHALISKRGHAMCCGWEAVVKQLSVVCVHRGKPWS